MNPKDEDPLQEEPKKKKWQLPSWEQWKYLFKTLSQKEKLILTGALLLCWVIAAGWGMSMYLRGTTSAPAKGGVYIEGLQGQPQYINPVISQKNPLDNDISRLIFSSLFKYDKEGKLEQDLAESWERSKDGLKYTVEVRDDAKWHDGKPLTAGDVLFTLNLIKNPQYGSSLRGNWEGITVEQTDENTLEFTIKKPYVPFLHNLTFGILPKHLWENISSDQFALTELNRKPVGSGPFAFTKLEKDKNGKVLSVSLERNINYYNTPPNYKEVSFKFYPSFEEIKEAYSSGEIEGVAYLEPGQAKEIQMEEGIEINALPTTRIFAIFFNQTKSILAAEKKMRKALNYATNKQALVDEALNGYGRVVNTPLLPNMLGFDPEAGLKEYDKEKAIEMFKEEKWKMLDEEQRKDLKDEEKEKALKYRYNKKQGKFLSLTLTLPNYPELLEVSDILKKQWEEVGVEVKIETLDTSETIQTRIQDRNYEVLLFGEILQADPDPTPFWHSSSKKAPGLNLALFSNTQVDEILDSARQKENEEERAELYKNFQKVIDEEFPVIFLFSPHYLYGVSNKYQGEEISIVFNPSDRFNDITERHLRSTRIRK